jgi:hypothetical protein
LTTFELRARIDRRCEKEDGNRLGVLLQDGRGLLLDFTASESLDALCKGRRGRLRYVASYAKYKRGLIETASMARHGTKAAEDLLVLVYVVSWRAWVTVVLCRVEYGDLYQKTTEGSFFETAGIYARFRLI